MAPGMDVDSPRDTPVERPRPLLVRKALTQDATPLPPPNPDAKWARKVRKAKRRIRSELSVNAGDWSRRRYAHDPTLLSAQGIVDTLPRVHGPNLKPTTFADTYERPRLPVILTGLLDEWPAAMWTFDSFRSEYGDVKFKLGTDDDGYPVRIKYKYYDDYRRSVEAAEDDSPLYMFEGSMADRDGQRDILEAYTVPRMFREDLFQHVGEGRRPPYKWVVMGPPRSGASLHIDPLSTHAWNALLHGRKRWALYPPSVPKSALVPPGVEREASVWFREVYPKTQDPTWPHVPPIDVIQHPGETIFVPCGWWHCVMNLDHTIAITQNYVSSSNFAVSWRWTRKGRPKLSQKWLERLRSVRPDLYSIAIDIEDSKDYDGYPTATSSSSTDSSDNEE